jgi:hypothetical protein
MGAEEKKPGQAEERSMEGQLSTGNTEQQAGVVIIAKMLSA